MGSIERLVYLLLFINKLSGRITPRNIEFACAMVYSVGLFVCERNSELRTLQDSCSM